MTKALSAPYCEASPIFDGVINLSLMWGIRRLWGIFGSAAQAFGRVMLPPLPEGFLLRRTVVALYFLGALGSMQPIPSTTFLTQVIAAAFITAAWMLGVTRRRGWRLARAAAATVTVLLFLCFLHFSFVLLMMFEWAAPRWLQLAQAVSAVAVLVTLIPRNLRARVPAMLLLGTFGVLPGIGLREDGVVRCDDYLRARAQPGVEIVIPTVLDEVSCQPGDILNAGRYPRNSWEAPDGQRFIITSQEPYGAGYGRPVKPRLTGSICGVRIDPKAPVQCVGRSKGSEIIEAPEHDRLFVFNWDKEGMNGGTLHVITRSEPFRVLAVRDFELPAGGGYYDPEYDLLAVGFEGYGFDFLHPGDLSFASEPVRVPIAGGQLHYDARRHEGLLCNSFGFEMPIDGYNAYLSAAFTGRPFKLRRIGSAERYPWAWLTAVWGCDWDPEASIVWVAIANLGVIVPIDYDTGQVLAGPYPYIGPGTRAVLFDKARHRLYVSKWTTGEVLAVSIDSGETLRKWFAGRWVRGISMSRDRRSIFLNGNLGVVRIAVDF